MIKSFFLLFCLFSVSAIFSQQDKQFTHYIFDRMSFNPAATGSNGYSGTVIYRNQWDRVVDAPNTVLFNMQGNLQNLRFGPGTVGAGLSYVNDAIGFQANNTLTINGAYHLPTSYGVLSAGVGLGLINVSFDPDWIPPTDVIDVVIESVSGSVSATGFDSNLGLLWYGNKDYYVGVSTTHVNPAKFALINFSVKRHFYIMAGKKSEIGMRFFELDYPLYLNSGVLIKTGGPTAVFDLNLIADVWLNNSFYLWGGATYRYSDAVALMFGGGSNGLKFGYSFDIMTNPLNKYGKGTHELMVSYGLFPPKRPTTRSGNPIILQ